MSSINIETLFWLLHLVRLLLYPSHYLLDHLLSLYTPTVQDNENGGIPLYKKLILSPIYVILLLLTLPLVLVFFPVRCLILIVRDPYTVSVKFKPYNTSKSDHLINGKIKKNQYGLVSCNICLLPEFMSRFNHLKDVGQRSRKIGERIVIDQFHGQDSNSNIRSHHLRSFQDKHLDRGELNHNNHLTEPEDVSGDIRTRFCNIDFMMIQEAWTTYYNKALINELHKVFPYIIHDAGVHSFSRNKFTLNSGLMVASRYPVAAVDFKAFNNYCKHGGLLSQGLLMVQVNLGGSRGQGRRVGYLFNTHMQSYQEDEIVIPSQMDEIIQFVDDFMSYTKRPNDEVLFNFLCGDFNCDNMSPGDEECRNHRLFDLYEDFGRERPGLDKEWTVGTELRQRFMFDPMMLTPKDMKMALQDPSHRRRFVIDADVQEHSLASLVHQDPPCDMYGNVLESPHGGKRRIDLITTHKANPVEVESYSFVTRLATLTDHIPVQMQFTC